MSKTIKYTGTQDRWPELAMEEAVVRLRPSPAGAPAGAEGARITPVIRRGTAPR